MRTVIITAIGQRQIHPVRRIRDAGERDDFVDSAVEKIRRAGLQIFVKGNGVRKRPAAEREPGPFFQISGKAEYKIRFRIVKHQHFFPHDRFLSGRDPLPQRIIQFNGDSKKIRRVHYAACRLLLSRLPGETFRSHFLFFHPDFSVFS